MLEIEATGQDTVTQKFKDDDPDSKSSSKIELYPDGHNVANSAAKNAGNMKLIEASECGSSITPALQQSDSYRRWNEMKRNGFLSTSHGGIPVPDRTRDLKKRKIEELKKKKTDPLKKQIEIAKREQVQRFTKIAAPSGLLNGLNPGIINHVRNSKQVHSIIEALVRSERHESNKKEENPENALHKCGCSHTEMAERRSYDETYDASQLKSDEMVALESSSSINTLSNEVASNQSSASSLSARAASVAYEWLELLYQDFDGRLAALQRSKKRIRAVIETELPFLIRKEFPSGECPNSVLSDMHRARWTPMFGQMEKTLIEEERHLESWLKQVKEMQLQCDIGLQCVKGQTLPRSTNMEESMVALRAVAASIFSTCNFAKTTGHAHFHV